MRTRTLNLPHTCPQIGPQMDWRFVVYYSKVWRIHTDALHKYLQFLQCPHVWHFFVRLALWMHPVSSTSTHGTASPHLYVVYHGIPMRFPIMPWGRNHQLRDFESPKRSIFRTEAEWLGWDQMGSIVSHWGYLEATKLSHLMIYRTAVLRMCHTENPSQRSSQRGHTP